MLKIYNTLKNKKQEFVTQEAGKVKMYNCGPTVYDYAHIGNLNAFLVADILRRYLEYKGFEVRQIMNITDVGHLTADEINQADTGQDKMLKASLREKKSPQEIADFYTQKFFEDVEKLNIKKANYYPRATAHIPQMIKVIQALLDKGLAYEKNGNVFYDVEKFENYGKLSKKNIDDLRHGARLEDHPDKKHPYDFALWLKAPKDHLMKWESPWSVGYPGWHIECTAMSIEYLGDTLDIHTGGEDHIFPHHENEIAQSEGVTGKNFSNFWLHVRFLLVDGKKMSKSKNNFYILQDIIDKGYDPMIFRLLILSSQYRSNLNFTWEAMDQAKINYQRISRFLENMEEVKNKKNDLENNKLIDLKSFKKKFEKAMDDDLNTPLALSVIYNFISETNKLSGKHQISSEEAGKILDLWNKFNQVLGLRFDGNRQEIPEEIKKLANERQVARENKDFTKADEIRELIEEKGYTIEDGKDGIRIKKI